jgi:hypothetical protein
LLELHTQKEIQCISTASLLQTLNAVNRILGIAIEGGVDDATLMSALDKLGFIATVLKHQKGKVYWDKIIVSCPEMSNESIEDLKRQVATVGTREKIIDILDKNYNDFTTVDIDIDYEQLKVFVILTKDTEECSICCKNNVVNQQKCKTCKQVNICKDCEKKQLEVYGRCAFCNTSYK